MKYRQFGVSSVNHSDSEVPGSEPCSISAGGQYKLSAIKIHTITGMDLTGLLKITKLTIHMESYNQRQVEQNVI